MATETEKLEMSELMAKPVDERRVELIQQRALGVELKDIVKSLAAKYKCSPKTIYHDWRRRRLWAPGLLGMDDGETLTIDIVSLLEWLRKRAVLEVLQGDNSNARIGAIKAARDVLHDLYDIAKDTGKIKITPEEMKLRVELSGLGKNPLGEKDHGNADGSPT